MLDFLYNNFFILTNLLQNIALITGILFIFFIIYEKSFGWIFGFISSCILIYISLISKVYMQGILNIYYAIIAVYAFINWNRKNANNNETVVKITNYNIRIHIILILILVIFSIIITYMISNLLDSNYPFLDALIFSFSVLATYMQANKIIANWIYWICVNIASIILYVLLGWYSIALLLLVYLSMAIWGYIKWKRV